MSTIQYSSSVNNAFISTVDHLPCDIIRSLWLIQSCNIAFDKQRSRLTELVTKLETDETLHKEHIASEIVQIKDMIRRLNTESVEESRSLYNQIMTHKMSLNEDLNQLHQMLQAKSNDYNNEEAQSKLRRDLEDHYNAHPLRSQLEALKEQERKKISKKKHSLNSGIKLVLKIPKKSKSLKASAAKTNRVKKPAVKTKDKPRKAEFVEVPIVPETMTEPEQDNEVYCFCKQPSFGDMIGCDNVDSCPNGDWFHYKCVGLLNRVDALKYSTGKQKWFCSEHCRKVVTDKIAKKKKKRRY